MFTETNDAKQGLANYSYAGDGGSNKERRTSLTGNSEENRLGRRTTQKDFINS